MLYKGYIKTKGKKAIEAFKDRTKYRTYDEVKNLEGFGGVLADDTILIDIDDAEQSEILMNIVEEYQLTCLMITHNMQSAIDLGNRILMMDSGNIVLDIGEEEKKNMTVDVLLEKFKTGAGKALDNDRILLSE